MLELTAAQTLITLPSVGCITGIGLASAVFTYYLIVSEAAYSSNPSLTSGSNPTLTEISPQKSPRPDTQKPRRSSRIVRYKLETPKDLRGFDRLICPALPEVGLIAEADKLLRDGRLLFGHAESIINASHGPLDHLPGW